jgi:transposase
MKKTARTIRPQAGATGSCKGRAKRGSRRKTHQHREIVHPNAAGIDIAVTGEIWVAVSEDASKTPVRSFSPLTPSLRQMVQWLKECQVDTVAMEATGSYWISLYLECIEAGLEVFLVNPRAIKGLARKTDMNDCQWLRYLHTVGLLKASFVPGREILSLRTLSRHRENLVSWSVQYLQQMQKALDELNVHIHHVISDLSGATGTAIIEAILQGERDPQKLAQLRHKGIKAPEQKIIASLQGRWDEEHLFVLQQAYESWKHIRQQIALCDEKTLQMAEKLVPRLSPEQLQEAREAIRERGAKRRSGSSSNDVPLLWKDRLHRLFGVDLTQVPGIGTLAVFVLLTELGTDWSSFPTAGHFASWLGLCPNHELSGGKVLRRSTRPVQSRLRNLLKCCAQSLASSQSHLGEQYRRIRARLGPAQANTAMAHKLARILWHLVTCQENYDESFLRQLDEHQLARTTRRMQRKAAELGYKLVPLNTPPAPEETSHVA